MKVLDYENKQAIQLSNDAFYLLYLQEEPLDEANIEEAEEIAATFPYGFMIEDDYEIVDTDLIEASFIPYKEDAFKAELYDDVTKYWRIEAIILSPTTIQYRYVLNGITKEVHEAHIINDNGRTRFTTHDKCIIPIWRMLKY
ncbi:MAG: hypothetical protein RR490_01625 [Niameybacter sp.]